ncbi:MAG: DUF2927 domain-containing protein [Oceanospirillaceae bacterium]
MLSLSLSAPELFATTVAWQKSAFIANSFYEIALGSEYGGAPLKVHKWTKPVRIYVEHQVGDSQLHNSLLNAQIADLRKITGLDIARVRSKSKANIKYYFTSQQKLPGLVSAVSGKRSLKYLKTSVCMATMSTSRDGSIKSAVVYIPVDQARMHAKLVACIVEELTQVMGLPRDSDAVYPSIFNDNSPNQTLTGLDVVLLKILYDNNVKAGMGKSKLRVVLKKVIAKLRSKGEVKKSTKISRSLSLCQYMDC